MLAVKIHVLIEWSRDDMEEFQVEDHSGHKIESEYIVVDEAAIEAMLMKNFIIVLGAGAIIKYHIYCDREGEIALSKEHRVHKGTIHILKNINTFKISLKKETS